MPPPKARIQRPRSVSTLGPPRLDGDRRPLDDAPYELFRVEARRARLGGEDQAVREHRRRDGLDVVRLHVVAARRDRTRLPDPQERNPGARAGTEVEP